MKTVSKYKLEVENLRQLFTHFSTNNYKSYGPVLKDSAIQTAELDSFDDLPRGIYEELAKGSYKILEKGDGSFFQYTVGPQSFKPYLHPARRKIFESERNSDGFKINEEQSKSEKRVFWGIRACDLSSIAVLDKVFLNQTFRNQDYEEKRKELVLIAVNCTKPSDNCLCTSVNTGPRVNSGYDFSVTEVFTEEEHFFLCETGNEFSDEICKKLNFKEAETFDIHRAEDLVEKSAESMRKDFNAIEAKELLARSFEKKHWLDISDRCLACANCTMVCPTCFCTSTEDITDLEGDHTERWLRWDSCFNGNHSYIHGGSIRNSIKSRYRQWLTHKLSTWYDQFDTSGCVGCGRCITWCPVGIDIREEIKALELEDHGRHKD